MSLPVGKAAEALGVSPQRVRQLLAGGRLTGQKVGGRWLVELPPMPRAPLRGRPLSARIAWAALALLSGEHPTWLSSSERSRLTKRMRVPGFLDALEDTEPRAAVTSLRVLPIDLDPILERERVVVTALAAGLAGLDLPARPAVHDGYVEAGAVHRVRRTFAPIESPTQPNLVLRVPTHPWILARGAAPAAVVAADLLMHADERVRRAARETLQELSV